jgi:hypothetical protein
MACPRQRQQKLWNASVAQALINVDAGLRLEGAMGKLSGIELKRARLVPSSVFASPDEVLQAAGLSRTQKIAILRRWEFDARPTTAHPAARQDGPILDQIRQALVNLGAAPPAAGRGTLTHH